MSTADVYCGFCGVCATDHRLPRGDAAVAAARRWMASLGDAGDVEGKMRGVLVGTAPDGCAVELRAVSGLQAGDDGLAAPTRIPHLTAAAEDATLRRLTELSRAIHSLGVAAARDALSNAPRPLDDEIERLVGERRRNKLQRAAERRALPDDATDRMHELEEVSRREKSILRELRRQRARCIAPLAVELAERLERRRELRAERRRLSRALQDAMHAAHGFVNFAARHASLSALFAAAGGIPSGAGECCAPKLLQEAARRQIRPHGIAEFWWGTPPADGSKRSGDFYGPCEARCRPLLGHLLCGAAAPLEPLAILYADERMVAVDKPAGMLSVRGRGSAAQDCVEQRLAFWRPDAAYVRAVHRLDQATSGVLLLALDPDAHQALARAFRDRTTRKDYVALVGGAVDPDRGEVRLAIGCQRDELPRRRVDPAGKPARTTFEVLSRHDARAALLLRPHSGRTHQLRIHCAAGLGAPIVGDTLYGGAAAPRLMLHAHRITVPHPSTGAPLVITAPLPFAGLCTPI